MNKQQHKLKQLKNYYSKTYRNAIKELKLSKYYHYNRLIGISMMIEDDILDNLNGDIKFKNIIIKIKNKYQKQIKKIINTNKTKQISTIDNGLYDKSTQTSIITLDELKENDIIHNYLGFFKIIRFTNTLIYTQKLKSLPTNKYKYKYNTDIVEKSTQKFKKSENNKFNLLNLNGYFYI